MKTLDELENYLESYKHTISSGIDPVFGLARADVWGMAQAYKKDELYLYDVQTLLDNYREWIMAELATVTPESEEDLSQVIEWVHAIEELSTLDGDTLLYQELGDTAIHIIRV